MFTAQEITARLRQQPFSPFTIVTSAGQTYDVMHPELVIVGVRDLHVGNPSSKDPMVYTGVSRLSLMHITALQDLPVQAPKNGQTAS